MLKLRLDSYPNYWNNHGLKLGVSVKGHEHQQKAIK